MGFSTGTKTRRDRLSKCAAESQRCWNSGQGMTTSWTGRQYVFLNGTILGYKAHGEVKALGSAAQVVTAYLAGHGQ